MEKTKTIIAVFKQDEEKGFKLLFKTYYEALWLFTNHIIDNTEDSRDLVQEFFVDFWINKRYNTITGNMDRYVFQSLKYSAISYLRNRKKQDNHMQSIPTEEEVVDEMDREERAAEEYERLYSTINRLPEERKKIFMMVCLKGMKYQEVADTLQISVGTVKTQMARSIKFLRENLKDYSFSLLQFLLFKKK